jgi:chemotaxis protein MotB
VFWGQPVIPSIAQAVAEVGSSASIGPVPETDVEVVQPPADTPRQISTVAVAAVPTPPAGRQEAPGPEQNSLPDVVERLASRGTPIVAQSGDRITTLQIGSAAFFSSGSAALSNAGKAILSEVAATLEAPRFAAYHITIEGHTDDTPISTPQFQSNWELSAARASAVVRFLLDLGVPAGKLTASGYADTVPIVPNRNAEGMVMPDNQARNRRVVIRLEKIDKVKR